MNKTADRYGPGIGDACVGSAARRLCDQITYAGQRPELATALAAVGELQEEIGVGRRRIGELERQLAELHERLEPDRHAAIEAQRALLFLTRGECISASRHTGRDTFATHTELAGCYCRRLAHEAPALDVALHAIVELCDTVHEMQHQTEDDQADIESLRRDVNRAYDIRDQVEDERAELLRALRDDIGLDIDEDDDNRRVVAAVFTELQRAQRSFVPAPAPDPWDDTYDAAGRDAIEREPVSIWTLLRKGWPLADAGSEP